MKELLKLGKEVLTFRLKALSRREMVFTRNDHLSFLLKNGIKVESYVDSTERHVKCQKFEGTVKT